MSIDIFIHIYDTAYRQIPVEQFLKNIYKREHLQNLVWYQQIYKEIYLDI